MNPEPEFGTNDNAIEPDDPRSFKKFLLMSARKEVMIQAKSAIWWTVIGVIVIGADYLSWTRLNFDNWMQACITGVLLALLTLCTVGAYQAHTNYVVASLFRNAIKLLPENVDRDDIGEQKLRLIEALYINYGNKTMLHHKAAAALRQLLTTKQYETD